MLRELVNAIARPLLIIFERSYKSGKVPEDWKKAIVTPVFKKGKMEGLVHSSFLGGKVTQRGCFIKGMDTEGTNESGLWKK